MRKVIFIDWYETLCFDKIWGHLQVENPSLFQKIQALLFANKSLNLDWLRGGIRFCNVYHYLEENGIDRYTTQTEFMRGLSMQKMADDTFLPIIQKLREQGYKVYIATDHFDIFGSYMYPYMNLEYYFDGYISSAEEGCLKNDGNIDGKYRFFERFLAENQLTPAECILIDNDTMTTHIYQSLGMQTFNPKTPKETVDVLKSLIA